MPYLLDTCAILFIAEKTTDLSPATLGLIDAVPEGKGDLKRPASTPLRRAVDEWQASW